MCPGRRPSFGRAIAQSLIVVMLIPLAIGLFAKARWTSLADDLQPHMSQASSVAILFMLVGAIILGWSDIVDLVGTGGLAAAIVFLLVAFAIGYFTAGSDPATKSGSPVVGGRAASGGVVRVRWGRR